MQKVVRIWSAATPDKQHVAGANTSISLTCTAGDVEVQRKQTHSISYSLKWMDSAQKSEDLVVPHMQHVAGV